MAGFGRTLPRPGRYPEEFKERAVRMVAEAGSQGRSRSQAIVSVAEKLGPTGETIRALVNRAEIDNGTLLGTTSQDAERIKQLERKNLS